MNLIEETARKLKLLEGIELHTITNLERDKIFETTFVNMCTTIVYPEQTLDDFDRRRVGDKSFITFMKLLAHQRRILIHLFVCISVIFKLFKKPLN
jgi:hypothetical protein